MFVVIASIFMVLALGLFMKLYFYRPDGNPFEITSYDYEWLKGQLRHEG